MSASRRYAAPTSTIAVPSYYIISRGKVGAAAFQAGDLKTSMIKGRQYISFLTNNYFPVVYTFLYTKLLLY